MAYLRNVGYLVCRSGHDPGVGSPRPRKTLRRVPRTASQPRWTPPSVVGGADEPAAGSSRRAANSRLSRRCFGASRSSKSCPLCRCQNQPGASPMAHSLKGFPPHRRTPPPDTLERNVKINLPKMPQQPFYPDVRAGRRKTRGAESFPSFPSAFYGRS